MTLLVNLQRAQHSDEAEFQNEEEEDDNGYEEEIEMEGLYNSEGNSKQTKAELVAFKAGTSAGGKLDII